MTKFYGLLAVLSVFLTGCGVDNQVDALPKPENLLPAKVMADALLATQILEARVVSEMGGMEKDSSLLVFREYEKKILEDLGTDSVAFYQSHAYYLSKPEEYLEIITVVTDSIAQRRDRVEASKKSGDEE